MNNSIDYDQKQLASYTVCISGIDTANLIQTAQDSLIAQTSLFDNKSTGLMGTKVSDGLQNLFDLWASEICNAPELKISTSAYSTWAEATMSIADIIVANITTRLCDISIDWDEVNNMRLANKQGTPIALEEESKYTIGNVSVKFSSIGKVIVNGKTASDIMTITEAKSPLLARHNLKEFQRLMFHVEPQTVKYQTKYAILTINGTDIEFKENSLQSSILRIMFGSRGKNRTKIEFIDLYELLKCEQQDWFETSKSDKNAFVTQIRNTVVAINNKIRKSIGDTDDFLKAKNNACYINPQVLNIKN